MPVAVATIETGTSLGLGGPSELGVTTIEVITGGVVSMTVTFELQLFMLPEASLTWHVSGVMPIGNSAPEGGVQVGVPTPGQLSETTGLSGTGAPLGLVHCTVGDGQLMLGGCRSCTSTLAIHDALSLF